VGGTRHPSIPLPVDLFGAWRNSGGIDLQERGTLRETATAIAGSCRCPSQSRHERSDADAIDRAQAAFGEWSTPAAVDERATILERLADSSRRTASS
jgi:RHH-type proline utilization regulon transcriptional repressor/proline dehydrogenase/delta 1-pyrroline-5-carboxylate dehydrogenase